MKRLGLILLLPLLAGCETLTIPREPAAEARPAVRPARLLVLTFDALAPTQEMPSLVARAARFSNAYVGQLTAAPEVAAAVLATGRFTRHLPFCDGVAMKGGKPVRLAELSLKALGRLLKPLETSRLGARLTGKVVAAAPHAKLARILGGNDAEIVTSDRVVARLQTANWRVAFFHAGGADPESTLARINPLITPETVLVVTALSGAGPAGTSLAPDAAKRAVASLDDGNGSRFWLANEDPVEIAKFASIVRNSPATLDVYTKQDTGNAVHYIRAYRHARIRGDTYKWAAERGQELVESSACRASASVVAASAETLEATQRIPLFIVAPGFSRLGSSDFPVRLVDVSAMVLRLFDIPLPEEVDGDSNPLGVFVAR